MSTPVLPPLYDRWISALLQGPVPAETESTCMDCPMLARDGRNKSEYLFHPDTKCCTYMPELPNFLVGRILRDEDPAFAPGKAAFEGQFSGGMIVTPLGAYPPESYSAFYRGNLDRFGVDPGMRCPFYLVKEGGLCGIWKHRNARCATWFCKYSHGSRSVIFWKYMDQLLTAVEKSLAQWCVLQLIDKDAALEELFPPPQSQVDLGRQKLFWGPWWLRQREFFQECSALVDSLSWEEVTAIGGQEVRIPARLVYLSYGRVNADRLPKYLRIASWKKVILQDSDFYRVWAYNRYDPLDVWKSVLDQLHHFDGQTPVASVLRRAKMMGVKLDRKLIRQFLDFGILEECDVPDR